MQTKQKPSKRARSEVRGVIESRAGLKSPAKSPAKTAVVRPAEGRVDGGAPDKSSVAPRTYPPCPPPGPARDKWVADLRARWPGKRQSPQPAAVEPDAAADTTEAADHDGRIKSALDGLHAKSGARDAKGRFITAYRVTTGAESQGFFQDLAPLKADIVAAVRSQLAADTDDAPPILLATIDAYVEVHLLRKSTWLQLSSRGGPVTNKGKIRGMLSAYKTFFDAEMRAAEKLGLVRVSRTVTASPREWLESSAKQRDTAPATEVEQQQQSQSQPTDTDTTDD